MGFFRHEEKDLQSSRDGRRYDDKLSWHEGKDLLSLAYGRYDHRLFSMDWSTGSMSYKTPVPKIK